MTASAQAADETEFKNSGEFRLRYFNDMNATGREAAGPRADTTSRFKWNVSARKGEKVQGYLSLVHSSQFGATSGTFDSNAASNLLIVNRAWGWWRATDTVSLKVGRIGIEIADGSVFSENDWENMPTAHEGLQVAIDTSFADLSIYALKLAELGKTEAVSADNETNTYVLSADLKNMPESVKMANVHVAQLMSDTPEGQNIQAVGATLGGDIAGFNYKATLASQMGVTTKTSTAETKASGMMYDILVGYSMPEMMGLKLNVGYHSDTGDDSTTTDKNEGYLAGFYEKHNNAGLMDVVRWGNLTYLSVGATLNPSEDYEVGAGYYMFSRSTDKDDASFGERFTSLSGGNGTGKDIGSELDIFANKSYDGGFKMGARFGTFMPGAYLKDGATKRDKSLMQAMLQASMSF